MGPSVCESCQKPLDVSPGSLRESCEVCGFENDLRPASEKPGREIVLTPASEIAPERALWLWEDRWAVGSFGLLAGLEGLGKSSAALDLAASITKGTLNGEFRGTPKAVLICATEDSWAHTIVPRLIAAGADLEMVYQVEVLPNGEGEGGLSLPLDTERLAPLVVKTGAALLILDPLLSRLSSKIDTHKDAEVRSALEPLTKVAEITGLFVLGIIHLNKGGGTNEVLDRIMGSRAFTAVARSVSVVMADPDDESDRGRIFGTPKNNLGRSDLPCRCFRIDEHKVPTAGRSASVGKVTWTGESTTSISEALHRSGESSTIRSARDDATEWLEIYMRQHGPKLPSMSIKEAGQAAGHSVPALQNARIRLNITSKRGNSFSAGTSWTLPIPDTVASLPLGGDISDTTETTEGTKG